MAHSPALPVLSIRDRWSLRLRLWRAGRAGVGERRSALLGAACAVAQGEWVATMVDGPASASGSALMGSAELRLFSGGMLDLGLCHRPTVAKIRQAMAAGPVVVERLADHGHCWGVYLRTASGSLGLLTARLVVAGGPGGVAVEGPLAYA